MIPARSPRRTIASLLALFVLAFGLSLQVGHRAAAGNVPGVVAGAWTVICGPAGKLFLPASDDGQRNTPHDQAPFCPVCFTLHLAAVSVPLPQGPALHAPASCGTAGYILAPEAAPSDPFYSPRTARGPPVRA